MIVPIKNNAVRQIQEAFPEKSREEVLRIFKAVARNAGMTILEQIMVNKKMLKNNYEKAKDVDAADNVRMELTNRNRGLIVLSPHMNNWEQLMGMVTYHMYVKHGEKEFLSKYVPYIVMSRMPTVYVDKLATDLRHRILRCNFVYTKQARYYIDKLLAQNKYVCFATDLDYRYRGVFVPFFGRAISMGRGPAYYALKNDVPICFLKAYYDKDGAYRVHAEEVPYERTGDMERDVYNLSAKIASLIEYWIRKHPEQWFSWLQHPWKTRPLEELQARLEKTPGDLLLMREIGQFHLAKGRPEDARKVFDDALAIDPNCHFAHLELGKLYLGEGQNHKAREHLFKALGIHTKDAETRKSIGLYFLEMDRPRTALSYFRKAIWSKYDMPECYWGKGRCLERLGKQKKAVRAYRKGLRVDWDHAPLHEALVDIYGRHESGGDVEEHLSALRRLCAPYGLDPSEPRGALESPLPERKADQAPDSSVNRVQTE